MRVQRFLFFVVFSIIIYIVLFNNLSRTCSIVCLLMGEWCGAVELEMSRHTITVNSRYLEVEVDFKLLISLSKFSGSRKQTSVVNRFI